MTRKSIYWYKSWFRIQLINIHEGHCMWSFVLYFTLKKGFWPIGFKEVKYIAHVIYSKANDSLGWNIEIRVAKNLSQYLVTESQLMAMPSLQLPLALSQSQPQLLEKGVTVCLTVTTHTLSLSCFRIFLGMPKYSCLNHMPIYIIVSIALL